jgi:hypothetical protein
MPMATCRAIVGAACLNLCVLALPGWAQTLTAPPPEVFAKCPDAMREAAQLRKAPRQEPATVTRPALRQNLLLMARQDQEARAHLLARGRIDMSTPEGAHLTQVDARNLRRLKHIVAQDGFPTVQMVGFDGVDAALLLTIHAAQDPDFQQEVLKLTVEHVRRGEVRSEQVATLTDDLLTGRGKKQRYGTNYDIRDGQWYPAPIEDEANVDARRREVGLLSLANDVCLTRALNAVPAGK